MKPNFALALLTLCSLMLSCEKKDVDARFNKIENNIAQFDIVNNTNKDILSITFEIKYLDNLNKLLLTDTVSYIRSEEDEKKRIPFLKANEETFITQTIPDNCKKADIKVLEIKN
jgi:hypothetical protein